CFAIASITRVIVRLPPCSPPRSTASLHPILPERNAASPRPARRGTPLPRPARSKSTRHSSRSRQGYLRSHRSCFRPFVTRILPRHLTQPNHDPAANPAQPVESAILLAFARRRGGERRFIKQLAVN